MYVVTADQIGSRTDVDRSAAMQRELQERYGDRLSLPVDQTAGDEVQVLTDRATTATELVLHLARDGHWSIGLGIGDVREPLPDAVRKATGGAFFAAREAVEAAKRGEARFALRTDGDDTGLLPAGDVEAIVRLLLLLRDRRTAQGWEAVDLVRSGRSQKHAAELLGISDAAVSQRLRTAMWSADDDARPAIVRLIASLGGDDPDEHAAPTSQPAPAGADAGA
ncbi:DNA-binding protein [Agromyces sp. SYSU T00266]|uniref:DNA-binding protein n=1 Tax=Agromyces zhanjiangensis TaxID=3158562 RepID=UPI003392B3D0